MTGSKRVHDNLPDTTAKLSETEADKEAQAERKDARKFYLHSLWLSPLLIVVGLAAWLCDWSLAFWLVIGLHYILLSGFRSRYAFARWHTAQWTLMASVALLLGVIGWGSVACLIPIAFGGWWLGNVVGLRQVNRGACWLWRRWDDTAELPRPWAVAPEAALAPAASAPTATPAETLPSPIRAEPVPAVRADAQAAFAQGMTLARQGQQDKAVACFMTAFREGSLLLRRRAVRELEKLGEVETF